MLALNAPAEIPGSLGALSFLFILCVELAPDVALGGDLEYPLRQKNHGSNDTSFFNTLQIYFIIFKSKIIREPPDP